MLRVMRMTVVLVVVVVLAMVDLLAAVLVLLAKETRDHMTRTWGPKVGGHRTRMGAHSMKVRGRRSTPLGDKVPLPHKRPLCNHQAWSLSKDFLTMRPA